MDPFGLPPRLACGINSISPPASNMETLREFNDPAGVDGFEQIFKSRMNWTFVCFTR